MRGRIACQSSVHLQTILDEKSYIGGHYAIFAEQNGAAEQRTVGLFFGRNKDNRARHDVALVGGNQRNDRHIRGNINFLLATLIVRGHCLTFNALNGISDRRVCHHA